MRRRALFLADGSSDLPLAQHVERLCHRHGLALDVVPVPSDRLRRGTGRRVQDRVAAVLATDPAFECVFVHRDAEAQDPERRHREVKTGANRAGFMGPTVAVVPIRMTEAWLLLDEAAIRRVAGRPSGQDPLDLPTVSEVERLADPKRRLREVLETAACVTGRRLRTFQRRFPDHRRRLLEQLDPDGRVTELGAWRRLNTDIAALAEALGGR